MKPSMKSPAISGPKPAGAISVSAATRSGDFAAISVATAPPSEWPTRCAEAIPFASMKSVTACREVARRAVADAPSTSRRGRAGRSHRPGGRPRASAWLNIQPTCRRRSRGSGGSACLRRARPSGSGCARPPASIVSGVGPPAEPFSGGLKFARNSPTKSSTSASGTPGSETTPSSAPTGTVSPSATTFLRSTPATGLSKTLAILVVSMSMISWPGGDLGALLDRPARERALLHGEAPFRHGDRLHREHRSCRVPCLVLPARRLRPRGGALAHHGTSLVYSAACFAP